MHEGGPRASRASGGSVASGEVVPPAGRSPYPEPMTDSVIARDVVVRGRVQGVFYRSEMSRRAAEAGVHGWVRNERDGEVRAHLEGDPDGIAALVSWMRHGPAGASVESLDELQADVDGYSTFEVRR